MKKLIGIALILSACGTWSNEDLEFLYALPDRDTLHANVPGEAASTNTTQQPLSVGDDSQTYAKTKETTDTFNAFLDQILDGLDAIRQVPPTTRLPDGRIWGPYDDSSHPGFQVQVEIDRNVDAGFDWKLSYRPDGQAFFDIGVGTFQPTVSLKEGIGSFQLNGLLSREEFDSGTATDPDLVTVGYMTEAEPKHVSMEFVKDGGTDGGVGTSDAVYAYSEDDAGEVIANFDVTGTDPNITTLQYTVRWDISGEGRADAVVTAGNYATAGWVECWDSSFKVVYSFQNWPGGADAGLASACVTIHDF